MQKANFFFCITFFTSHDTDKLRHSHTQRERECEREREKEREKIHTYTDTDIMEGGHQMEDDVERAANANNNSVLLEEDDFLTGFEKNIPVELVQTLKTSSFTQKLFVGVLVFNHLVYWFVPNSQDFLALIPDKTIPTHFWNVFSAGYFETNPLNLLFSCFMLIFIGKFVEASWDAVEFCKFILVTNACIGATTFVIMFILYVVTRDQYFLFAKISGFHGVIAALLVALLQLSPDECVAFNLPKWIPSFAHPPQSVRNKHLILMYVSCTLGWCIFRGAEHHSFGIWLFDIIGATMAWTYLRFFQQIKGREGYGDSSPLFAFHMLFPPGIRYVVLKFISTPLYYVFCNARAREEAALEGENSTTYSSTKSNNVLSKILHFKKNTMTTTTPSPPTTGDGADNADDPEMKRKNELAERATKLVEQRMLNSSSA